MATVDPAPATPTRPITARSVVALGLTGACPHCGEGRLFAGFLTLQPRCEVCGLSFDFADAGDGPAVFIMMIVGFIVIGSALMLELRHHPPIRVHLMLWLPLATFLAIAILRPLKGTMIALQYRNAAREGRLERMS